MPCRDEQADAEYAKIRDKQFSELSAMLCAVFTVLESSMNLPRFLDKIDWKEAGVARKDLENWWKEHKKQDDERQKREAESNRIAKLRTSALSKLTAAEKSALKIT